MYLDHWEQSITLKKVYAICEIINLVSFKIQNLSVAGAAPCSYSSLLNLETTLDMPLVALTELLTLDVKLETFKCTLLKHMVSTCITIVQ